MRSECASRVLRVSAAQLWPLDQTLNKGLRLNMKKGGKSLTRGPSPPQNAPGGRPLLHERKLQKQTHSKELRSKLVLPVTGRLVAQQSGNPEIVPTHSLEVAELKTAFGGLKVRPNFPEIQGNTFDGCGWKALFLRASRRDGGAAAKIVEETQTRCVCVWHTHGNMSSRGRTSASPSVSQPAATLWRCCCCLPVRKSRAPSSFRPSNSRTLCFL